MADDEITEETIAPAPSLAHGPNPALSAQAGVDATQVAAETAALTAAAEEAEASPAKAAKDESTHKSAGGKAGGRA